MDVEQAAERLAADHQEEDVPQSRKTAVQSLRREPKLLVDLDVQSPEDLVTLLIRKPRMQLNAVVNGSDAAVKQLNAVQLPNVVQQPNVVQLRNAVANRLDAAGLLRNAAVKLLDVSVLLRNAVVLLRNVVVN